ncbi:mannose-6-phosphate isomerase, class I [Naasia lichenicola]|uniref:mannose-6-phosphate isomerase n=1 Tax=Naasia lichenicola TaxID=2565933 RepID=A0A4S4FP02_9MICO|nr:mannose-6-phosphate isomerase, class I [Naasia lichenicola]THG30734.1 mannose-6-phosphate isomerase, class I [Naasia lichenicola]THG31971.1 mannose-6-phosphate isomerase, class I [Naasia lichenicola]
MFLGITNVPRDYAWGSTTAIAELLGHQPSGKPEAELWLGAHPAWPSRIVDTTQSDGMATLDAWIAADPARALGDARTSDTLPFLLKLLAANEPLSIQAHPSIAQAEAGYDREDAAGISLDDPARNYKDRLHKPELTLALSDTFEALAGFRELSHTQLLVEELVAIASALGSELELSALGQLRAQLDDPDPAAALRGTMAWLLGGSDGSKLAIEAISRFASEAPRVSSFAREYATIAELAQRHPGDPGIGVALLLNRITLPQGQAAYLPSGNVHAYLAGLAVEIMAASDNVLRGGLTSKHIDTDELLDVVQFTPLPAPIWPAEDGGAGMEIFRPDVPDFALARITIGAAAEKHGHQLSGGAEATFPLDGPGIVLVVQGSVAIVGAATSTMLERGESAFITPDEGALTFSGSGVAFVATTNR